MNFQLPKWGIYAIGIGPLIGIFALLIWAIAIPGSSGLGVFDETGEAKVIQEEASGFDIELFDGQALSLSDLKGRPILLDFWGSWCVPCRAEAATLEKVWRDYKSQDIVFLGIAVFDTDPEARAFVEEFNISYLNGSDPKGKIGVQYGLIGVPEKFFINREGVIEKRVVGPMNEKRLVGALNDLLNNEP